LALGGGLVLVMVVIHSSGLVGISRLLRLHDDARIPERFGLGGLILMGEFGFLLFALHIAEIFVFALFYMWVSAIASLEEALYYSASAYATLGWTADYFPSEWRLIGALEALIGFILIGWSTAFMVRTLRKIME
jgi:hypothetical protein